MATDPATARAWRAGPDEAEAVARLVVGFRDHMGKGWPSENAMLAGVERLMEDPATVYLLAAPDDDSPPAGYAQLRFRHSLWTAAPDCWIEDVFVDAGARRRGVADALVARALDVARARGARRAELDTSEDNEAALALYARHGFEGNSKGGGRDLFLGVKLTPPSA